MVPKPLRPGPDANARSAAQRAAKIAPVIADIRATGAKTLQAIADGLNERRIPTAAGSGKWSPVQVARVLQRI
jgi:hypothetical protein